MYYRIIKPIVKNKSPVSCVGGLPNFSKEKSPVERTKSSVTKAKIHSKEKLIVDTLPLASVTPIIEEEIKSLPKLKPPKLKKLTPVSSTIVDIPPTISSNSSTSSVEVSNSTTSNNKSKVKTAKKSKKTLTQPHPAFYFVSILLIKY